MRWEKSENSIAGGGGGAGVNRAGVIEPTKNWGSSVPGLGPEISHDEISAREIVGGSMVKQLFTESQTSDPFSGPPHGAAQQYECHVLLIFGVHGGEGSSLASLWPLHPAMDDPGRPILSLSMHEQCRKVGHKASHNVACGGAGKAWIAEASMLFSTGEMAPQRLAST